MISLFHPDDSVRPARLFIDPGRSFAAKYPDVPPPEGRLSPILLAARWISNDIPCEKMPEIAADLLEAGFDALAVARVAGEMRVASRADIEPLVARMFTGLGVAYPLSEADAARITARQMAREVIAGTRNAWAAASRLYRLFPYWSQSAVRTVDLYLIIDALDAVGTWGRPLADLDDDLYEEFAKIAAMEV